MSKKLPVLATPKAKSYEEKFGYPPLAEKPFDKAEYAKAVSAAIARENAYHNAA